MRKFNKSAWLIFLITASIVLGQEENAVIVIGDEEPLAINAEIEAFVKTHISPHQSNLNRVQQLVFMIFSEEGLELGYHNAYTQTAIETFQTRKGNCISFTFLFVAMARSLGLKAHFQEISQFSTWEKRGQITVNNKHMNALVEADGRMLEIDFFPNQEKRPHVSRVISDEHANAHYYNNKGAEAYSKKEEDLARAYFVKAVEKSPDFSKAWCNMGVLNRVQGRFAEAEKCYLKALELDPVEYSAMSNLSHLYDLMDRPKDAEKFRKKVEKHRQKNPFHHEYLAKEAFSNGDYKSAVRHLKRAVQLNPEEPDFYHGLAQIYHAMDVPKQVEKYLKRAKKYSKTPEQRQKFDRKIEYLLANSERVAGEN